MAGRKDRSPMGVVTALTDTVRPKEDEAKMTLCPLMGMKPCPGDACAWFDLNSNECAVLSIADALQEVRDKHTEEVECNCTNSSCT